MGKAYKAYLTLILTEGSDIMVSKNISVGFAVTSSHGILKYLPRILLSGLYF